MGQPLKQNEPALRARGVTHAAIFGSRARGDNRSDSDTNIMIEIDPDAPVGVYEHASATRRPGMTTAHLSCRDTPSGAHAPSQHSIPND